MAGIIDDLNGFDKAAILYQVLGDSLSLTLFKNLSETEKLQLKVRSTELANTSFSIKKAVLEEYYFKLMSNKYQDHQETDSPFDFLAKLDDEQLFYLLNTEKPRIIALAIEQLDEEKQFNFLSKLEADVKNKVIIELGGLTSIPLEAVLTSAKELEKKAAFIPKPKKFKRGGGKSIAAILGKMSEDESAAYMTQIEQEDPELFSEVKKFFLSYGDLMGMPENMAQEFWMNPDLDLDILAKAIKGYEDDVVKKILGYMPEKKQAMFTAVDGPLAKREVEEARAIILEMAKSKVKSGEWRIEDVIGGEGTGDMIE